MGLSIPAALTVSHAALVHTSGIIFFLATIFYTIDILRDKTKTNRSAYAIWSVANVAHRCTLMQPLGLGTDLAAQIVEAGSYIGAGDTK
jgi:hypothetical protein